jgi:hypothetical protein
MTINVYKSSIHTYIQHICVHRHSIPRRLDPYDFIAFSCFGANKVSVTLLKRHKVAWLLAIHPSTAAVYMYRTVFLLGRNNTASTERPSACAQPWLIPRSHGTNMSRTSACTRLLYAHVRTRSDAATKTTNAFLQYSLTGGRGTELTSFTVSNSQ